MNELRKQLQSARKQYEQARYPGDLAAEMLGEAASGSPVGSADHALGSSHRGWWIGTIGAVAAIAAAVAIVIGTFNQPENASSGSKRAVAINPPKTASPLNVPNIDDSTNHASSTAAAVATTSEVSLGTSWPALAVHSGASQAFAVSAPDDGLAISVPSLSLSFDEMTSPPADSSSSSNASSPTGDGSGASSEGSTQENEDPL